MLVERSPLFAPRTATFVELAGSCFEGEVDSAAQAVVERAQAGTGGYVCFCNVHVLVTARRNPELRDVLRRAALRFPDGAPVAWLQRRGGDGDRRTARIGGPDLMARVVETGEPDALRHFFLGSTDPLLGQLTDRLRERSPAMRVAGTWAPPFGPLDDSVTGEMIDRVGSTDAQIVWLGLGAPKQELLMPALAEALPDRLFLGVGAAFDFLSGAKPRAPRWMHRFGLEWTHRLAHEPRRLTGRYLRTNSAFVLGVTRELSRRRSV
jgi:N-acetylglucosaminyldiphosphoundecaprenol N-acetyl-beta-D-mannosaminyltransferase